MLILARQPGGPLGLLASSLVVRPWAYATSHAITKRAAAMLNVNAMKRLGTFYVGQTHHDRRAVFLTFTAQGRTARRGMSSWSAS